MNDEFDKHFERVSKVMDSGFKTGNWIARLALIGVIGGWCVGLGVLGFIGWVIVKILQSQGVI